MLDENLENKDTLNPIQEEDQESVASECHTTEDSAKKNVCEEDNEEDIKYQFPDTQIKIDLSGPK